MKALKKISQYFRVNKTLLFNKKVDYANIRKYHIEMLFKQFIWPKNIIADKYDEIYVFHKNHLVTYDLTKSYMDSLQYQATIEELMYVNSNIGKNVSL